MTIALMEPDKVAAVAAVEKNIAAEEAMADQHESEGTKLRAELNNNLGQLSEKSHRELLDKIAAAERASGRTKARAAAMRNEREIACRAELEARRRLLEAAVLESAGTYRDHYNSLIAPLIALLTKVKSVDDAVETFNRDSAGLDIPSLQTIEGTTRRQNGRLPRSLYGQLELPSFEDVAPLRVAGTHEHTF